MATFDSKSFNPQAFGKYVEKIANPVQNQLAKCGAVGSNANAHNALSSQTGSLYARVPYFGRISGSTSQNNNGATNITSSATSTFEQGFVTASRMDGWTEKSFSKNITAGVDFMSNVASQISEYKLEVKQAMLLSILAGIYDMPTTGTTVPKKANKAFVEGHTLDITDATNPMVGATTLNSAMQKACGDNKGIFKMVIMHSEVATNLENLRLLDYLKYTDADGVQRDLTLGTWNGRLVLIDDGVPVTTVEAVGDVPAYNEYTTYVLGANSIILDDIGDSVPYEMYRDPKTNGGQDTLYVRDRFICGVDGISFEKPSSLTASASNSDLAEGDNWQVINDGTSAIPSKAIAIARIISRG